MKELLFSVTKKDFEITYFNGTGKGGQHRNKHKNCVRIKHIETGIITTGQDERSLNMNLKNAFKRMTENVKFKIWLNNKILERNRKIIDVEKKVNNMMKDENLKIEYLQGELNEKNR